MTLSDIGSEYLKQSPGIAVNRTIRSQDGIYGLTTLYFVRPRIPPEFGYLGGLYYRLHHCRHPTHLAVTEMSPVSHGFRGENCDSTSAVVTTWVTNERDCRSTQHFLQSQQLLHVY